MKPQFQNIRTVNVQLMWYAIFQTVESRIFCHWNGDGSESTTWTCSCPLWKVEDMRTEGAKTVGLKYSAGETYLSLSWIQRCFIYWKVGLIVIVNCSFPFFTFFSLASPSHCSFSMQGSKTLQSKSLVNSYYSGMCVTHLFTNTHTHNSKGALGTDWLGVKSCTFPPPETDIDVLALCIMAAIFPIFLPSLLTSNIF